MDVCGEGNGRGGGRAWLMNYRVVAVWVRDLWDWGKSYKSSVLLNFAEPLLNLLAMGYGLGAFVHRMGGVSFIEYIAPGLMAVTAMNAATFDAGWGTYERLHESRIYDSMANTPLGPREIVTGELLWEAFRALLYGLTFLVVMVAFGLVRSLWILAAPLVLAPLGVLFGAPAMAVGCAARSIDDLFYYYTLVVTPMFLFSGVFFPVSALPVVVRDAAMALPLYHAVNLLRSLSLGTVSAANLIDWLWLVGYAGLVSLLPTRILARRLER